MADVTVSIKAGGQVTADDLRVAAGTIADLLAALMREAGSDVPVDWVVDKLEAGSAMIRLRPLFASAAGAVLAAAVAQQYDQVGEAASQGRIDGFSPAVQEPLRRAARLVKGPLTSVELGAGEKATPWTIDPTIAIGEDVAPEGIDVGMAADAVFHTYVRTAIKGKIVTLGDKRNTYFTLRRAYTGENVQCYPDGDDVALRSRLSELWRAKAWVLVEGTYNQRTDKPTLHFITDVVPLPPAMPGGWRQAVGAAPRDPAGSTISAADAVRKVRDGEA